VSRRSSVCGPCRTVHSHHAGAALLLELNYQAPRTPRLWTLTRLPLSLNAIWRRERDSNPRGFGCPCGLQERRLAWCGVPRSDAVNTNHDSTVVAKCRLVSPRAAAVGVRLGVVAVAQKRRGMRAHPAPTAWRPSLVGLAGQVAGCNACAHSPRFRTPARKRGWASSGLRVPRLACCGA
jgi:hypothetical protein